jgi:hypothetical protein
LPWKEERERREKKTPKLKGKTPGEKRGARCVFCLNYCFKIFIS